MLRRSPRVRNNRRVVEGLNGVVEKSNTPRRLVDGSFAYDEVSE